MTAQGDTWLRVHIESQGKISPNFINSKTRNKSRYLSYQVFTVKIFQSIIFRVVAPRSLGLDINIQTTNLLVLYLLFPLFCVCFPCYYWHNLTVVWIQCCGRALTKAAPRGHQSPWARKKWSGVILHRNCRQSLVQDRSVVVQSSLHLWASARNSILAGEVYMSTEMCRIFTT